MSRDKCKECPWREENNNTHSIKFRTYVDKMKTIGKDNHSCHMINRDICGGNSEINEKNVCIGSKQRREK